MNRKRAGNMFRAGFAALPMALAACGGGGDGPAVCTNAAACAIVGSAPAPSSQALFTTAPSAVTLNAGSGSDYSIGGGSPPYTVTSGNPAVATASVSRNTLSINGVAAGTTPVSVSDSLGKSVSVSVTVLGGAPAPGTQALFTNAPSAITLNTGFGATYNVGGGSPPYSATGANTNIVTASMSGSTLVINGVAAGASSVTVVDSLGKALNIETTVLPREQSGTPLSLAPRSVTVGDCTTNIPFIFSGGVGPYTVFTSDNFNVPVSSPLRLGVLNSSYFTATVDYRRVTLTTPPPPIMATLTVLDSQSRTATATITTPSIQQPCPNNPLLQVFPESANFRASEVRAFQISGPVVTDPSQIDVSFADPSVARLVSRTKTTIEIQAASVILAPVTTLMTITVKDAEKINVVQKANVIIAVLPQSVKAEGAYSGTFTGSSSSSVFDLLVLENDDYWVIYGTLAGTALRVNGFIQGSANSSETTFTSSDAKDFGFSLLPPGL